MQNFDTNDHSGNLFCKYMVFSAVQSFKNNMT